MDQPMNERIVKVETQLENHEKRLNKHGEEIDELKINTIRQDSELAQLRAELAKNTETTEANHGVLQEIRTQVKTVGWIGWGIIGAIPVALTIFESLKKSGIL